MTKVCHLRRFVDKAMAPRAYVKLQKLNNLIVTVTLRYFWHGEKGAIIVKYTPWSVKSFKISSNTCADNEALFELFGS